MTLSLNINIVIDEIKEGYALFNCFTGGTHILPRNFGKVLLALSKESFSEYELLNLYSSYLQVDVEHSDENEQFQQFITEAINSGIIVEN